MGSSPSVPTVPHMYQELSAPWGKVHLLWLRISPRKHQIQERLAALPAASCAGSSMDMSLNSQHGPDGAQFQAGSGMPNALSNTCTHEQKRIECGPSAAKLPTPGLQGG